MIKPPPNSQSSWLNFITFDIIGDLSFRRDFDCLEAGVVHPWVKIMFSSLRAIVYLAALAHLPTLVFRAVIAVLGYFMLGDLKKDAEFSIERVAGRLKQGTDRKDFMSPILE